MMRDLSAGKIAAAACALAIIWGCGSAPSPLESLSVPIRLVRNDTITQVEDSKGRLYVLNSVEKINYNTAFIDLGEELVLETTK